MKRIDRCCNILNKWANDRMRLKYNIVPTFDDPFTISGIWDCSIRFNYKNYPSPLILATLEHGNGYNRWKLDRFLLDYIGNILLTFEVYRFETMYTDGHEIYYYDKIAKTWKLDLPF